MSEAYFRSILDRPERARTMLYDIVPSSPPSGRYNSWNVVHIPHSYNSVTVQATRQRTQSEPLKHFHPTPLVASKKTLDMKVALNISSTDALNISASVFSKEEAHKIGLDYLSCVYEEINAKDVTGASSHEDDDLSLSIERLTFWKNKFQELMTARTEIDKNALEILVNINEIIDCLSSNSIYCYRHNEFNAAENSLRNFLQSPEETPLDTSYDACLKQYKLKLTSSKKFLYSKNEEIIEGNNSYTALVGMLKEHRYSINKNTGCPLHNISTQRSMPIPIPGAPADHIEQRSMNMVSQLASRLNEDESMISSYGTPLVEGSGRDYAKHILTNILNHLSDLTHK